MKIRLQLLSILIIAPALLKAQAWVPSKYLKVDKKATANAINLRSQFPDDDVIITDADEIYTFFVAQNKDKERTVACNKVGFENFLALKEYANVLAVEGYNDFISINKFRANVYTKSSKTYYTDIFSRAYESEEIFDNDQRIMYSRLPLSTTGVRAGTRIEKTFKDIRFLTKVFLTNRYSAQDRFITFEIPNWLSLELKEFNFDGYNITKDSVIKSNYTIVTYHIKDTKAIPKEPYMADVSRFMPHIVVLPKSFTYNKEEINIFNDAGGLYKWYADIAKDVKNEQDSLKPIVNKIIKGKTNDEEKIKAIYYWVQDNIKYIAFERGIAGFKPEAAFTTYNNKFGDCKAMANLLANMLQVAGFDARLAWIGTNDIPYDYSVPSLCVNNHMICALKYKGKTYFLDGTEKFIALDDNGQRIQGKQTLVQDGEKYSIETVPSHQLERNKHSYTANFNIVDDLLNGVHTETYRGESQVQFLNRYHDLGESDKDKLLLRILARFDKDYDISKIRNSDLNNRELPIELNYESKIANKIINNGNTLMISLDNEASFSRMIPEPDRKNPIYVDDRIYREYEITLDVPPGYFVKELPKPFIVKEDDYNFDISYTQVGNKVIMKKKIIIDKLLVPMSRMDKWRKDIKNLNLNSNAFVILTK